MRLGRNCVGAISLFWLLASGQIVSSVEADEAFRCPTIISSGQELRFDICRTWGGDCGQPAADAFCRSRGFDYAPYYWTDNDVGDLSPTYVSGAGRVCTDRACDAFREIICARDGEGDQVNYSAGPEPEPCPEPRALNHASIVVRQAGDTTTFVASLLTADDNRDASVQRIAPGVYKVDVGSALRLETPVSIQVQALNRADALVACMPASRTQQLTVQCMAIDGSRATDSDFALTVLVPTTLDRRSRNGFFTVPSDDSMFPNAQDQFPRGGIVVAKRDDEYRARRFGEEFPLLNGSKYVLMTGFVDGPGPKFCGPTRYAGNGSFMDVVCVNGVGRNIDGVSSVAILRPDRLDQIAAASISVRESGARVVRSTEPGLISARRRGQGVTRIRLPSWSADARTTFHVTAHYPAGPCVVWDRPGQPFIDVACHNSDGWAIDNDFDVTVFNNAS